MLDRDLDEAEEQYQMALRNHLIHVNELIDLQSSRLRGLDEEFERDVEIIQSEFDGEKADIFMSHQQERRELKDMIETIEEEETNKLNDMKEAYDSSREETKNKNVEDLESMKHDLIKKIEELDKEFEVNFNKYVADTDIKAKGYKTLLEKNGQSADEINNKQREINRLKEQTSFLTMKIQQSKKQSETRNSQVRLEKEMIVKHYHDLKHIMANSRNKEEKRLGDLTNNSKACMDKLTEYQKLGEKILKTAELCRKLETEKEKVLPFYQSDEVQMEEIPDIYIEKIEGMKKAKYNEF